MVLTQRVKGSVAGLVVRRDIDDDLQPLVFNDDIQIELNEPNAAPELEEIESKPEEEYLVDEVERVRTTHQDQLMVNCVGDRAPEPPCNYLSYIIRLIGTYKAVLRQILNNNDDDGPFYKDVVNLLAYLNKMKEAIEQFLPAFLAWKLKRSESITAMEALDLPELDKVQRKADITKVVTGCAGVVGGGMAIAGMALAPFTLGVSLGLLVPGIAIGITASGVTIGAVVEQFTKESDKAKSFMTSFQADLDQSKDLQVKINKLEMLSRHIEQLVKKNNRIHEELQHLIIPKTQITLSDAEHGTVFRAIPGSLGLVAIDDLVAITVKGTTNVAARVAGIVFASAGIVLDVVQIGIAARAIDTGCKNQKGHFFQKVLQLMKDEQENLQELYEQTKEE